jgi:group II intron reverse transcriptase/maturase
MKDKVRVLQRGLYRAAKAQKERRFGVLYDKVYRIDILKAAWERVRANKGSAGVDGQTIEDIEKHGVRGYLRELTDELREKRYRPARVRRTYIPKPGKKEKRPLGIPVIKDRVVQAATKIVIEPIFEAGFQPCSYGFRPKRDAHQAHEAVAKYVNYGCTQVIDADLKKYFEKIPHEKLMEIVAKRISDINVLRLLRWWLKAGVMEDDRVQYNDAGTPQGGVISPLLANIYLNELDRIWTKRGYNSIRYEAHLVRYADDMVVLCRKEVQRYYREFKNEIEQLGLELNETKTRIVDARQGFDFLGMRFAYRRTRRGKMNCYKWPSPKAMKSVKEKARQAIGERGNWNLEEAIRRVNPVIRGWGNYFRYGNSFRQFDKIDRYIYWRLRWRYYVEHRKRRRGMSDFPRDLYQEKGLYRLRGTLRRYGTEN